MDALFDAFKAVRNKIDETDYSGYTIQYPPMFAWGPIGTDDVLGGWKKSLRRRHDHLGLYVHIPFCATRCTFCRYYAIALSQERNIDGYLSALKNEILIYRDIFNDIPFHTLYIGGGTPSLLSHKQLKFFFETLYGNLNFEHKRQVVFEGVSDFLNFEKLSYLKEMGLDRLTLGVQTLEEGILKEVNRHQNNGEFFRCYQDARRAGIKFVNVDLMLGLPGQTLDSVWRNLRDVIKVQPDMIHCHPFYPAKFTALQDKDIKKTAKMVRLAKEIVKKYGYRETRYDADALTPDAVNIQLSDAIEHNSSYLGVGVAAVSHATGYLRTANIEDIKLYMSRLQKKELAVTKGCKLSEKDEMIYYVTSTLRYGYVPQKGFRDLFGRNLSEVFEKEIAFLKNTQKLEEGNDGLVSLMADYDEYAIYSKVFFDPRIINEFLIQKSEK